MRTHTAAFLLEMAVLGTVRCVLVGCRRLGWRGCDIGGESYAGQYNHELARELGTPPVVPNLAKHKDIVLTQAQATALLTHWYGSEVRCNQMAPLEGGICSAVFDLRFERPPYSAVVKLRRDTDDDPLPRERLRLEYLRGHTNVPCPQVYLQDGSLSIIPYSFLLIERLPGINLGSAELRPDERGTVERELAEVLNELHSHTHDTFGDFRTESGTRDWVDVFIPRLEDIRGEMDALLSSSALREVDRALALAHDAFGVQGLPTLIHHDMSPGNIMVERHSDGWHLTGVLDPVGMQYADVELELAYLEAWTVGEPFFEAYKHPLRPGYQFRRLFYWLHTYMVHVWLGVSSELHDCILSTARRVTSLGPNAARAGR